jgi:hypothetical protein
MQYEITFEDWTNVREQPVVAMPRLRLWTDRHEPLCLVGVILPDLFAGELLNELGGESDQTRRRLEQAMIAFAMERIEGWIAEGEAPTERELELRTVKITEEDLDRFRALLARDKGCEYQHREGRDLYCTAALRKGDPATIGTIGLRGVARTSPIGCMQCDMPDEKVLCSHLSHPSVAQDSTSQVRFVQSAYCAVAAGTAGPECRPDGNKCWTRLVSAPKWKSTPLASPLELTEALDFLDAVWRNAFGARLLRPGPITSSARLAQSCETRADFEANMSALADLMKRMAIADSLLPEGSEIPADHTFDRLGAVLDSRLGQEAAESARREIDVLKAVNGVRVALQHGKSDLLSKALTTLGLSLSPDWKETWDAVRARVSQAVTVIRAELQETLD